MEILRKITQDTLFIGVNDRRIALFENVYPVPDGVSYNSYIIIDEKTCLIDTVDKSGEKQFKENVAAALGGRKLDYIVVNHMEPDHSATLEEIVKNYPEATVVCTTKASNMIKNYTDIFVDVKAVKEGDTLELGKHTLKFIEAPMIHWPEVMMTYDEYTKTLFSADAFGSFGALSGNLYADEVKDGSPYIDEMRRYYTNIVGKYGVQVQSVLKKASGLKIENVCPLHGLIWRKNIDLLLEKYVLWATYSHEINGVLIVYSSVYGNTENAAEILAARLSDDGVQHIKVYDASKTDCSYLVSESFAYSHIAIASTTYNAGIFVAMENFLSDLVAHGIQNKTFAIIENGSWAPTAGKLITEKLSTLKNCKFISQPVKIISSVKQDTKQQIVDLADEIASTLTLPEEIIPDAANIDKTSLFKLTYGLFVLTSNDEKQNGCIINTVMQITDTPKRIAIAVNKANFTYEIIAKTKKFNVSVLSEKAPFEIFERFGFHTGRDINKFDNFDKVEISSNGINYISEYTNAYLSAEVIAINDYGTHALFIADVTEAKTFNDDKSMTYAYYFENVKPKAQAQKGKTEWVCKICGYKYEGDELPEDFICPICKHGADDFEKIS